MNLDDFPFARFTENIDKKEFAINILEFFNNSDSAIFSGIEYAYTTYKKVIKVEKYSVIVKDCYEIADLINQVLTNMKKLNVETFGSRVITECSGKDGDHDDTVSILIVE